MTRPRIALIGYGEVGHMLAADLAGKADGAIAVYDLRFEDARDPLAGEASADGLDVCARLATALSGRDLVICAVTAGSALAVAEAAADELDGAVFLDLNSVSPSTKQAAAAAVNAQGGRYVEAAVMAPVAPRRIATPMLFGGPQAQAFLPVAEALGFRAEVQAETVGPASAVKMCRSVFVKGLESIVVECLVAARRYGVETEVLGSLSNTIAADWPKLSAYLISRALIHGRRRSEEMTEVVRTLEDAGLDAWMSAGAVRRQAWAAELGLAAGEPPPGDMGLDAMLDAILSVASGRASS